MDHHLSNEWTTDSLLSSSPPTPCLPLPSTSLSNPGRELWLIDLQGSILWKPWLKQGPDPTEAIPSGKDGSWHKLSWIKFSACYATAGLRLRTVVWKPKSPGGPGLFSVRCPHSVRLALNAKCRSETSEGRSPNEGLCSQNTLVSINY